MSPVLHLSIKVFLYLLLFLASVFIIFLVYSRITEFSPPDKAVICEGTDDALPLSARSFTLTTWNLGYCGLGAEMDFFYDGGKMVRPSPELFERYCQGIINTLSHFSSHDFLLLQEVDLHSRRSYYHNQQEAVSAVFPHYHHYFTVNYQVDFVPLPVNNPMGRVKSGISLLSKHGGGHTKAVYYPSSYRWPVSMFMLKRAFLRTSIPLSDGSRLVVYNTHHSAFDDGRLRAVEMQTILKDMVAQYKKGYYVIAGGDWNQNPPGFDPAYDPLNYNLTAIKPPLNREDLPRGWQTAYAPGIPTNRWNDMPFHKGESKTTIIDYFILSPNISVDTIHTYDLQFRDTDHQPVSVTVTLNTPHGVNPSGEQLAPE